MTIISCLSCEHAVDLGPNPAIGQRITCPNCETNLEVINLHPVELDWVYEEPQTYISSLYDEDWWLYPPVATSDLD